jgi:polyhydroxyalkanoate synthesis regulator phasin
MVLKTVYNGAKRIARKGMLMGLGITAVVTENVRDLADNAGPYSDKLVERGQQTSEQIAEAYEQRRQQIRRRNGQ